MVTVVAHSLWSRVAKLRKANALLCTITTEHLATRSETFNKKSPLSLARG